MELPKKVQEAIEKVVKDAGGEIGAIEVVRVNGKGEISSSGKLPASDFMSAGPCGHTQKLIKTFPLTKQFAKDVKDLENMRTDHETQAIRIDSLHDGLWSRMKENYDLYAYDHVAISDDNTLLEVFEHEKPVLSPIQDVAKK